MPSTRIFIIHEKPERLSQATRLLTMNSHLHVIHMMSSVHECLARISKANSDLILVSATLPNDDTYKFLKQLRQQAIPAKVIVTDVPNDPKQILTYIAAGASGYVLFQEGVEAWAKQIDAVCSGQPLVSPRMAASMIAHLARLAKLAGRHLQKPRLYSNLTRREQEILLLLGEGNSNLVIASRLIITVGTVKNHVHNILTKLNLNSRKGASIYLDFVR